MEINMTKSELELTILQPWVELADHLAVPRSIGQLCGLLFISKMLAFSGFYKAFRRNGGFNLQLSEAR